MILLISGLKRSGKDTLAEYITTKGFTHYSFATPIKEVAKIVFNWSDDQVNHGDRETIDPIWGVSPRQMLQWIGTEVFQYSIDKSFPLFEEKIGRKLWVEKFVQEFNKNCWKDVVISDTRFPHEVSHIKERLPNQKVISIQIVNNTLEYAEDTHESESHMNDIPYDYLIENDSSLQELYKHTDEILKKIKEGD